MTDPLLSIIIPVHDDVVGLERTLASLHRDRSGLDHEIIVCDDAGPPEILALAAKFKCVHIRLRKNGGAYAARNAGLAMARGKYAAFLDADQIVSEGWMREGVTALAAFDYVGGRVEVEDPGTDAPWIRYDRHRAFPFETYRRAGWFPTANLFTSMTLFDRVGPFNQALRSTGDTEFGDRVRASGARIGCAPRALSFHPARDRSEILAKNRRIAAGRAKLYVAVRRVHPLRVTIQELSRVALAVPRFTWRAITRSGERYELGARDFMRFLAFDEVLLAHRAWWLVFESWRVRFGSHTPYQDAPIDLHQRTKKSHLSEGVDK